MRIKRIKLSLGIAAATGALVWCAVAFATDPAAVSVVSPYCTDGSCVPRRLTNGYYPTSWRRWPVDPPARDRPGVREGIPAPNMELPPPRMETFLPEGVLVAPPPLDQGGGDDGFGAPPRDSMPGTPPPGPAAPRGGSPQGVPPELRSERLRLPNENAIPERQRASAGRAINRPAAVIESLRSEAAANPSAENKGDAAANVPAALPKDEGAAQPLSPPPGDEKPATRPMAHWAPMLHSLPSDIERAEPADHGSGRPGRTNWSPARNNEDAAQPKAAISQPDARSRFASTEPAAIRQATIGPNAPAAIYARTVADNRQRSATPANLTLSAPHAPAVLAVRIESDEGWNPNPEFRNPLRGARAVTKVAFEDREAPSSENTGDSLSRVQSSMESAQFDAPDNPLR